MIKLVTFIPSSERRGTQDEKRARKRRSTRTTQAQATAKVQATAQVQATAHTQATAFGSVSNRSCQFLRKQRKALAGKRCWKRGVRWKSSNGKRKKILGARKMINLKD